jgi:osmoprotectant transport system ATP-binding protein
MVFVTHGVREAFVLGTRIGLIKEGRLILLGPPGLLLESNDPEARAFAQCFHEATSAETAR